MNIQLVLNTVLNHMGLYWLISSNKHMEYDMKNTDWFNKGPWYNRAICSKLQGTVFGDYIRNDGTDRYNLIYDITAHDKILPVYVGDTSSGGSRPITMNATTASLESLVAILNIIDFSTNNFITIIKLNGNV